MALRGDGTANCFQHSTGIRPACWPGKPSFASTQERPSEPAKPPWMIVLNPPWIPEMLAGPEITDGHWPSGLGDVAHAHHTIAQRQC